MNGVSPLCKKDYKAENHFVLLEINGGSAGRTYETYFEIPAEKFEDFCREYGIPAQPAYSVGAERLS